MIKKGDKTCHALESIPGIGKSIANDLRDLGIHEVNDLVSQSPEALYDDFCRIHKMHIDRCVLYVFRCAVYYAEHDYHEPELLKWWNWKDRIS